MKLNSQIISKILFYGVALSAAFIVFGGIWFLVQNWQQPVTWLLQQPSQKLTNLWSSQAFIMYGLILLLATQFIRVLVTSFLFLKNREITLSIISLMIFLVLIAAFWI